MDKSYKNKKRKSKFKKNYVKIYKKGVYVFNNTNLSKRNDGFLYKIKIKNK